MWGGAIVNILTNKPESVLGSTEQCGGEGLGGLRSPWPVSSEELHLSQEMSDRREPATQRWGVRDMSEGGPRV